MNETGSRFAIRATLLVRRTSSVDGSYQDGVDNAASMSSRVTPISARRRSSHRRDAEADRDAPALWETLHAPCDRRQRIGDKGKLGDVGQGCRGLRGHGALSGFGSGAEVASGTLCESLHNLTMADRKRTRSLIGKTCVSSWQLPEAGRCRRPRVNCMSIMRRSPSCRSLEGLLGLILFERRASGYLLTAAGKAVLDEAAPWMRPRSPCCAALTAARS